MADDSSSSDDSGAAQALKAKGGLPFHSIFNDFAGLAVPKDGRQASRNRQDDEGGMLAIEAMMSDADSEGSFPGSIGHVSQQEYGSDRGTPGPKLVQSVTRASEAMMETVHGQVRDVTNTLANRPVSLRKGHNLARLDFQGHLEISFKMQFQELPESTLAARAGDLQFLDENTHWDVVSIFQVTVDGNLKTEWPAMKAAVRYHDDHEWLEVITFLRHGGVLLRVTHILDLEKAMGSLSVQVRVKTLPGPTGTQLQLEAEINGEPKRERWEGDPDEILVPEQARADVFFASPICVPANAQVREVNCTRHLQGQEEEIVHKVYDMMLPARVQELQAKHAHEKEWMFFDACFGILVIMNGIWIGIEVSYDFAGGVVIVVNNTFLSIFVFELLLRYRLAHIRLQTFLHDPWISLDVVIVAAGAYDAWLSEVVETPFPPTVLRLVRLLRLGRMVRLLNLFRALGLLVDSMLSTTQVVLWTLLLMMIFVYSTGIIMTRSQEFARNGRAITSGVKPGANATADALILYEWSSLSNSMWIIMQMVTADGDWAERVRELAFVVGGLDGMVMSLVLIGVMIVGTIGLMNMVIALLCRTAFSLHRTQREMHAARAIAKKQKLIPKLRELVRKQVEETSYSRRFAVSTEDLLSLYKESEELRKILAGLDVSRTDLLTFGLVFEDDGVLDLEGMYEVIAGLQMEEFFKAAESQEFLFGPELLGTVRPADMLAYRTSSKTLEALTSSSSRTVHGLCALLHNLNDTAHQVLRDAGATEKIEPVDTDHGLPSTAVKQEPSILRGAWEAHLKGVDLESAEAKLSIRMDLAACIVILVNALLLGLQLEHRAFNRLWIDVVFTSIFSTEFCLRAVLFSHVRNLYEEIAHQQGSPEWIGKQFEEFQKRMLLGIIPPFPLGGPSEVCSNMPLMLKDPMALFDVTIIFICIVDNILVAATGTSGQSFNSVGAFRVLRLLRLGIVLRVFAVAPKLQILLDAMIWTRATIFWIACTMLLLVYGVCSTILLFLVGPSGQVEDPEVAPYFGSLYAACVSGWQIVTFDTWGSLVEVVVGSSAGTSILIAILVGLGGLSAMNIGIAVMSEAAVRFTKIHDKKAQVQDLMNFMHQMTELEKVIVAKVGSPILSAEVIEAATGIKISKRADWDSEGPPFDSKVNEALQQSKVLIQDGDFMFALQEIFFKADLQPEYVKMIFERTDKECLGYTYVESFSQGALCTKTNLIRIDILLSGVLLRSFRTQIAELRRLTVSCQSLATTVLEQSCALINRRALNVASHPRATGAGHILPDRIGKAIDDINAWREDCVLPFVRATGTVAVVRGSGKLNLESGGSTRLNKRPQQGQNRGSAAAEETRDKVKGVGTSFFEEVGPGDYILVEDPSRNQLHALCVQTVQSNTHLRCLPSSRVGVIQDAKYMIAKRKESEVTRPKFRSEGPTSTIDLNGLVTSSPHNSEGFMAWEIETKRATANKVARLKRERKYLTAQFEMLLHDLYEKHVNENLHDVWKQWRAFIDSVRQTKHKGPARIGWMGRHYEKWQSSFSALADAKDASQQNFSI